MTVHDHGGGRVLLVDDHPAVRQGVALLLAAGRHLVGGEADDVAAARARLVDDDAINLVLLDLSLGEGSGLDLIADLVERGIPALIYSMYEDPEVIERALDFGALGYVTKREEPLVLLEAVASVLSGQRFVSPRAAASLADRDKDAARGEPERGLSDRERQILHAMGRGESSAEIATSLSLSVRTVETYCARMLEKLDLSGMKALRKFAISHFRTP